MGWRAQDARDRDARAEWRAQPLRERYAWGRLALVAATVAAGLALGWLLK